MAKRDKKITVKGVVLVFAIALVLVGGGFQLVKADVGNTKEPVIVALSSFLTTNPDSPLGARIAGKLLDTLLGDEVLGSGVVSSMDGDVTNFRGLGLIDPDTNRVVAQKCRTDFFPKSTSTIFSLKNNSKNVWQVDYISFRLNRAATAAVVVSFGTSTVNSVAFNAGRTATATLPNGWIDRYYIASSSRIALVTNFFNGTSTEAGATDMGSTINGAVGKIGSALAAGTNPLLRVGRNEQPVGVVEAGEYFLGHIELGQYTSGGGYHLAVTTTVSSTPASDGNSALLRESGQIGLTGVTTVCWKEISTSTPQ